MPWARVNGIGIDYKVEGQGDPVLFVSGLGEGRGGWILQTRTLRKHFTCITFDNRGVGKSDRPPGPYTIRMMADDAAALLEFLGIRKAHVVGVSMGGMIAQELALNYPEKVDRLVLACTFARPEGLDGRTSTPEAAIQDYRKEPLDEASKRRMDAAIVDLAFNKWYYRVLLVPIAKVALRFSPAGGRSSQLEACLTHDTVERLHCITAPTLVITGTDDRLIRPSSSDLIASLVPTARLIKLQGGGHALPIEMSGAFNRELLSFLR